MSILNQKPSGVMLDSYNSRISKLMKYTANDIVSYELVDSTATGKTIANVTMSNGNVEPVNVMRYKLNEVLVPNADGYVILNTSTVESAVLVFPGGMAGLSDVIARASGVDLGDSDMLGSLEFEVSLTLWILHEVFIPPTEITLTQITNEPGVIEYTASLTESAYAAFNVQANADALGYTGSVKLVLVTTPQGPSEE